MLLELPFNTYFYETSSGNVIIQFPERVS